MATIYTRAAKGSALTWTEGDANITNLNTDKIEAVSDDTAPTLGGNLDVAGFEIFNGVTNGDIVLTPNGVGVVILDGDLDLTTGVITSGATNQDITIDPNGTGVVVISGLTYPTADGTSGQVLTTDGAGVLSFTTVSGGASTLDGLTDVTIASVADGQVLVYNGTSSQWENTTVDGGLDNVVEDTTPQLGGNLDVNGNSIVSVSNGNIVIAPNGTGMTMLNNIEYHEKIHSLGTTSGTITPDVANGNVQTITLNGNLTFSAFSNPIAGQSLTLIIKTNGTGRTLTSTMKFAGSSKVLSTTNTTDIISVFYDGTDYWASLSKGFA